MISIIVSILLLSGTLFCLIAALGIVRMPDVYCRMHAATKAGAFGLCLILLALVMAQPGVRVIIQSMMIVGFFYLTAPLASMSIGRASLSLGMGTWQPGSKKGATNTCTQDSGKPVQAP